MSAYFNLGQMSAQAAVMRVKASKRHPDGVKAFVEQAVVRRELSDNLCFYNGWWMCSLTCVGCHVLWVLCFFLFVVSQAVFGSCRAEAPMCLQ